LRFSAKTSSMLAFSSWRMFNRRRIKDVVGFLASEAGIPFSVSPSASVVDPND